MVVLCVWKTGVRFPVPSRRACPPASADGWVEPGDPTAWREIAAMPTWRDGFPSRAEAISRYAGRTGLDVGAVGWHQVFAAFKLAVIIQQIYIRWVRGQTQDPRFRCYGRRVLGLAAKAQRLIAAG